MAFDITDTTVSMTVFRNLLEGLATGPGGQASPSKCFKVANIMFHKFVLEAFYSRNPMTHNPHLR